MDIKAMKSLPYEELRSQYKRFLLSQNIEPTTINTAYTDTFYLWRKGNSELFWSTVESSDAAAKDMIVKTLLQNSRGNATKLSCGYLSHIRRFRLFLETDGLAANNNKGADLNSKAMPMIRRKKTSIDVPIPSVGQVEYYLKKWDSLENYHLQEDALDKLFFCLAPQNQEISDILLKASTLNDFYSTNIFSIYPVAKHILALNIDDRLHAGDVTLVRDIQHITINGAEKNFYSFATKYCSHHKPLDYPIYDSYVDEVLRYFRNRDGFAEFADGDLKIYEIFKSILITFRNYYGLEQYNLKQIDQYIWQLGKDYFPKRYGKLV